MNIEHPEKIQSYLKAEWKILAVVTVTGLFYNVGLLAGPLFEGRLAQCLFEILEGKKEFSDMLRLAATYVTVTAAVQGIRYLKRFYVRRFANNVNLNMKHVLYGNLVHKSRAELAADNVGAIMTKAISDVDACAEGIRKFVTEIFDTGVALCGYVALLCGYDWKLALLCLIFPPLSYLIAEKMKKRVQESSAALKESAGRLSAATLDRVSNGITYRVYGCEDRRTEVYDVCLADYERSAVRAGVLTAAMPPLYHLISMAGVLFILVFGSRNCLGMGAVRWDIAAFTAFLSCFTKLSVKSSKAAKLFNAVQKAEVSWKRIRPYMTCPPVEYKEERAGRQELVMKDVRVFWPGNPPVFSGLSFTAGPGQVIGITGPVACGKTTLGLVFLREALYSGSITLAGEELSGLSERERNMRIAYMGHDPELLSDTIQENILLGTDGGVGQYLAGVCMEQETKEMPQGTETVIGSGGVRLSGGQQARVALARTLAHKKPVLILDDPFSALDRETEKEVFLHLRQMAPDSLILLISHRLYLFSETDLVVWLENGAATVKPHAHMMRENSHYAALYEKQCAGGNEDER